MRLDENSRPVYLDEEDTHRGTTPPAERLNEEQLMRKLDAIKMLARRSVHSEVKLDQDGVLVLPAGIQLTEKRFGLLTELNRQVKILIDQNFLPDRAVDVRVE